MSTQACAHLVALALCPWQAQEFPEYRLKAFLLYNFGTTVALKWPDKAFADGAAPFVIAVFAKNPFGEELEAACKGRQAQGRPVEIRRTGKLEDLAGCNIVFVPRGTSDLLPEILKTLQRRPVLVVGESEGFAAAGGAINFVLRKNKVEFEVNQKALERAGIEARAAFLRMGTIVEERK